MYTYIIKFADDKTRTPIECVSPFELRAGDCFPIDNYMYRILARYIMNLKFTSEPIELAVVRLIYK